LQRAQPSVTAEAEALPEPPEDRPPHGMRLVEDEPEAPSP